MLPKSLIVNCWNVLYLDRHREERVERMTAILAGLLAEAGIQGPADAAVRICRRLAEDAGLHPNTCAAAPLVQRVMDFSKAGGLPIPSQVASAFARKASQVAVNFAPPSQFPDDFKMLKKLAAHYAMVLVANTSVPNGQGLREVLDGDHLLQYFRATIFSDEFGVGLPDAGLYRAGLEFLRMEPRDVMVIAGDEAADLPAARMLNLPAILVRREAGAGGQARPEVSAQNSGVESVASLAELVRRLKAD